MGIYGHQKKKNDTGILNPKPQSLNLKNLQNILTVFANKKAIFPTKSHWAWLNDPPSGGRLFDGDIKIEWQYHVQCFYVFLGFQVP